MSINAPEPGQAAPVTPLGIFGGDRAPAGPSPNEAPDDPHRIARAILDGYRHPEGYTLTFYRGSFHGWDGACYRPMADFESTTLVQAIKREVDRINVLALESYHQRADDGAIAGRVGRAAKPPVATRVTSQFITSIGRVLVSLAGLGRDGESQPFWIKPGPDDPGPADVIPAMNGLLDISGDEPIIHPHTPRFFSGNLLSFDYDPEAPYPKLWYGFLAYQWPSDGASINALHEMMGDLLNPIGKIHGMFLWIGGTRSGRGTAQEVATELIGGDGRVAATSPASLSDKFGLEPLIGKSVAFMGDARVGDSHDTAMLTDRILRISANDPVDVNLKNRKQLSGLRLGLRLVCVSNEMPNIRDSSGAIITRYVILDWPKTRPAEERDADLSSKLKAELPGILNLALKGRADLKARGRFLQPPSAAHLIDDAGEMASPVAMCVAECFDVHPAESIEAKSAFEIWKQWAIDHGYSPGNTGTFGKNLKAAVRSLRKQRPRSGERQVCLYTGIGRKADVPDGPPYPPPPGY